jgi:hypothetical protein
MATRSEDDTSNADETISAAFSSVWNWYFEGTNSVCPPIFGTTGTSPALLYQLT